MPSRLLVTGAGGFVGRHLLAALARDLPGVAVHPAGFDITDAAGLRAALRALRPDCCLHLAAVSAVAAARAQPELAWRVNLLGTLDLAAAILELAPACRLIFVASADAYGASFSAARPLDETAALAPLNTYAATKAAADLALGALVGEGLQVVRLRPFNHTGPGQSEGFVVAAFARQLARIEAGLQPPRLLVGALDPRRDFLDVRDVCAAYVACIERCEDLAAGTVLNLASGIPRRIGDVLDQLVALCRVPVEVALDPDRLRAVDIMHALGDAARAQAVLGWRPRIGWDQTMRDVMADWRARVAV